MTYTQLENIYIYAILAFSIAAPIATIIYVKILYAKDFPGKKQISELRIDIGEFSGIVADLTERFARFQSKEGMRVAREAKAEQATILEQARAIAAEEPVQEASPSKLDLYKRRSRMQ